MPRNTKHQTSMSTKTKRPQGKKRKEIPGLVWFEIPADKPARARKFYGRLFGWKINPFPGMADYWHIGTGGSDASPDGGMLPRKHPAHGITNYISVPSVTRFMAKVKKLGGKVCVAKTAAPGLGYFAICEDTEKNTFAIWESNDKAK